MTVKSSSGYTVFFEGPVYKVKETTTLTDDLPISKCKSLGRLQKGEVLDLLKFNHDEEVDVPRILCLRRKDNTIDWASVKSNSGTLVLEALGMMGTYGRRGYP